jgi:homoserine O-succinyltransferase
LQIDNFPQVNEARKLSLFPANLGDGDEIVIGLVNIMPLSARRATERAFRSLLEAGAKQSKVRLRCFTLDDRWKLGPARSQLLVGCEPISALWGARLDGLIVTGAEPRAATIADEPLLPYIKKLVSWASENTASAIFSCFAGHCAVWCMDGIARQRYTEKLSGIFSWSQACHHALTEKLPSSWSVPHSRHNTVDEVALEQAGYSIISRAPRLGVDMFSKEHGNSEFLFFQGHPEYGPDNLLGEYCRDLRRFMNGSAHQYPDWPKNYLDDASRDAFAKLRQYPRGAKALEIMDDIEMKSAKTLSHGWHDASVKIFGGWLHSIIERKTSPSSLRI